MDIRAATKEAEREPGREQLSIVVDNRAATLRIRAGHEPFSIVVGINRAATMKAGREPLSIVVGIRAATTKAGRAREPFSLVVGIKIATTKAGREP